MPECLQANTQTCLNANMFAELLIYWFSSIKAFNMRGNKHANM